MARTGCKSRDQFLWLLLRFSVVLGVTNHFFDRATQQLTYSPKAFAYRVALHITSLILVYVHFEQMTSSLAELLQRRQFFMEVAYAFIFTSVFVIVHCSISEWLNHGKGTKPFNELLRFPIENVRKCKAHASIERDTWKLLCLKMLALALTTLILVLTSANECCLTVSSIVSISAFNLLQFVHMSIQFQFTVAMLYGAYLFKVLNLRLSQVVGEINDSMYVSRRKSQRLKGELTRLGNCHTSLLKLLNRIKQIYQFDLLVILATLFAMQVCVIFYVMLSLRGTLWKVTTASYVTEAGNTFVNTIDLLITLYICDDCMRACNASGDVMRGLRTQPVLHCSLDRDIETLCFQFAQEKMRFNICGLLDVDIHTGPVMIEGLIMKVILLTQIGYNELR